MQINDDDPSYALYGGSSLANRGDGHQIWMVAANVTNKLQYSGPQTTGVSLAWGLGEEVTTPRCDKQLACFKMLQEVATELAKHKFDSVGGNDESR